MLKPKDKAIKIKYNKTVEQKKIEYNKVIKAYEKQQEIVKKLLEELEEKNTTLLCPHGRPLVVKLTKTDIEKWFKRIV